MVIWIGNILECNFDFVGVFFRFVKILNDNFNVF